MAVQVEASSEIPTLSSPFLNPGPTATASTLAVLHLRRDQVLPTLLQTTDVHDEGYDEGKVTNTRFGSFPHSTLIGLPWGSQVPASAVDTGSRGRRSKKRKLDQRDADSPTSNDASSAPAAAPKRAVAAASGFCHILPPTPESWTISLPHRTQVVYTPDSSFILQKLRVRPGSVVLEAGAGSGSFTHAAARAVYSGVAPPHGAVHSFEYHAPRAETLRAELEAHGLLPLASITHRDVYRHGFLPAAPDAAPLNATAVFLDLPQPWHALPHLTRTPPTPLHPGRPVHAAFFLPCIEQVSRLAGALRSRGWVELSVHEVAQRRLDVRRERVGLAFEGLRGVNAGPRDVGESVARLRVVEGRWLERRGLGAAKEEVVEEEGKEASLLDGRVVVRTEPETKTHTSYLVFAVLPMEWGEEEERRCRARWPVDAAAMVGGEGKKKGKKGKGGGV